MQNKKGRGRPSTGRTTKHIRVPKHLEIPAKKYIQALQTGHLDPIPEKVNSYLIRCLVDGIHLPLSMLKEELKEWTSNNVARLGFSETHQAIKNLYGSKFADCIIHIPNSKQLWWEVLQVSPGANPEEVKNCYKKMCFQWHPDLNSDPNATEAMRWINKAWENYRSIT